MGYKQHLLAETPQKNGLVAIAWLKHHGKNALAPEQKSARISKLKAACESLSSH